MRILIAAFILLLPLQAFCSKVETIDWSLIRFDKLDGTVAGFTIGETVNGLTYKLGTEYEDSLSEGNTWWCIVQILELMATVAEQSELSEDPVGNELIGKHSGYDWAFWRDLARVGQAVDSLGRSEVLDNEVERVIAEMEAAFLPLLKPTDPAPVQKGPR